MDRPETAPGTRLLEGLGAAPSLSMRRAELTVEAGPDAGRSVPLARLSLRVGSDPDNDLVLADETVSGRHFELRATERGVLLEDLGSTNGTLVDGNLVGRIFLRRTSRIVAGRTSLRFALLRGEVELPLSRATDFCGLLGHGHAMRAAFALLESAARSDATVLITGESGTGKELAARGIHERSRRSEEPFVVLDCGAAAPSLVEAQLFGHVRGAFTGAFEGRAGVFEAAHRGTLVLDEIGEMALELQPKLLRALETRTVQRVGESSPREVDVRFVACTNRNLEEEVRAGRFRADLLFRLSVVTVRLPPLRERKEEIPRLVRHFLARLGGDPAQDLPDGVMGLLQAHDWPGNVRELRNFVDRFLALPGVDPMALLPQGRRPATGPELRPVSTDLPFHEAKQLWTDVFEKSYLGDLLERHGGNVSAVARVAGLSRQTCYRLIEKHGLRVE